MASILTSLLAAGAVAPEPSRTAPLRRTVRPAVGRAAGPATTRRPFAAKAPHPVPALRMRRPPGSALAADGAAPLVATAGSPAGGSARFEAKRADR
jgi:hypothetical protein